MSETRRVVMLYIRIGNCNLLAEGRRPVRHPLPPKDWVAKVIPILPDVAVDLETTAGRRDRCPESRFDFLRGVVLLEAHLPLTGTPEMKLRLKTPVSSTNDAFVVAARKCRVIWTDRCDFAWIHRILGVTVVAQSDGRIVSLRLAARRAIDVSRWADDQSFELGGNKIALPSAGNLIVASGFDGEEMVSTAQLPIPKVSRVS